MALLACGVLSLAACADDDKGGGGDRIDNLDEWCDVISEVDVQFDATDNSDGDFAAKQPAYQNLARLLTRLTDSLDVVPAEVRPDVANALEFASAISTALGSSASQEEADTALVPLFDTENDPVTPAQPWILETCGVDISG